MLELCTLDRLGRCMISSPIRNVLSMEVETYKEATIPLEVKDTADISEQYSTTNL
jgi:hypothetical protein